MSQPIEYCDHCGEATGRGGKWGDSIYVELVRDWYRPSGAIFPKGDEVGPLCEACRDELKADGLIE